MAAMFSTPTSTKGGANGNLLEIKAGKLSMQGGSKPGYKKCVPEKTKGLIFIKQSNDGLTHFCWKNLENGAVVDDLIIFPGDTDFMRVRECTDGKVFLLKFKTSTDRRLFWIQDGTPDIEKDLCEKVNDILNKQPHQRSAAGRNTHERFAGPNAFSSFTGSGSKGARLPASLNRDDIASFGGLDQGQLMQLLSLMGPGNDDSFGASQEGADGGPDGAEVDASSSSVLADAAGHSTPKAGPADYDKMRQLVAGMASAGPRADGCDLTDVLRGQEVKQVLEQNSEQFVANSILVDDVPEAEASSKQEVVDTPSQPTFQQAVGVFNYAFASGQIGPVLQQFGLPDDVVQAASSGDILKFATTLTDKEAPKKEGASTSDDTMDTQSEETREPEPKRGKTDDGDDMELD
ncbi:unnamed protein product, partial [Mesorhabditis spiculigera]